MRPLGDSIVEEPGAQSATPRRIRLRGTVDKIGQVHREAERVSQTARSHRKPTGQPHALENYTRKLGGCPKRNFGSYFSQKINSLCVLDSTPSRICEDSCAASYLSSSSQGIRGVWVWPPVEASPVAHPSRAFAASESKTSKR